MKESHQTFKVSTLIRLVYKTLQHSMAIGVPKAGEREGGRGGQNIRGPECSEGPAKLGRMFVYCLSSAIYRGTGAPVHKSPFCPGTRSWLSPALVVPSMRISGIFLFLCGLFPLFFFVTGAIISCYQFGCLFSFFTSSSKFDNFSLLGTDYICG